MDERKAIIEALIFASESPLSVDKIADILTDTTKDELERIINELINEHERRQGGFLLKEVAGGLQFITRETFGRWISKIKGGKQVILSAAAMETLAVIAYRQPVVKSEIDKIRGVDASGALKGLLEKKLIRMMGRKDVPGKPIIYGTTKKFLEFFNLKDLSELPTLREINDLQGKP